ncbi:MAG: bifunctional UDP-N-acetylglucosamine diphosphorylase/glucosamine-1-phosphate N-acetyltransferase GlmU [Alphaproteobacteria bacterium]
MKAVIILSAGHGKRMKSVLPKVLHKVAGKPMLQWVLDAVKILNADQVITVTSPELESHEILKDTDVVVQAVPLGTGDALKLGVQKLKSNIDKVFLLCADTPLLDPQDIKKLEHSKADLTVIGMQLNDLSKSYGRIECNSECHPVAIRETKHNEKVKNISLGNAGVYAFRVEMLKELLPHLKINTESGEIYATDLVELAITKSYKTELVIADEENFLGVNTLVELSQAEKIMQHRIKTQHMLNGVQFLLPDTNYVNYDAKIGAGTIIEQSVHIGENVHIAQNAKILSFSYLSNCTIESAASIGPFAHLRGNVVIEERASIGNFVEVKGSTIGKNAKAKHLSYIGDATVGEGANIGAGTITCNYNGFEKFKTHIGKNVMIGANSTLVAPVMISDGAYIAAGSVITEDVGPDNLAISRTQQREKNAWALSFRAKYSKKLS